MNPSSIKRVGPRVLLVLEGGTEWIYGLERTGAGLEGVNEEGIGAKGLNTPA